MCSFAGGLVLDRDRAAIDGSLGGYINHEWALCLMPCKGRLAAYKEMPK